MGSGASSKRKISTARVLAAAAAWRTLGRVKSAETLAAAMSSEDEQSRMIAGMSLVKAGTRSFDFIEQKIADGGASASLVQLLPDLDGVRARAVLERLVDEGPGELREAAQESLDLLDRIEALKEPVSDGEGEP